MLPGFELQQNMSPPLRKKTSIEQAKAYNAKESAVLILLFEKNNEPYIVLTERKVYKGAHSGQISLPGGKRELNETLQENALRETQEEIGVESKKVEILLQLTHLYIPVSNFIVFPFVGKVNDVPEFIKEESEVEKILEVKVSDLLNTQNIVEKTIQIKSKNIQFKSPAYAVNNVEVWGATAMILCEFLSIIES
ncbi:MAG: NUDIX hydrolase [Chitinophagales bacterium]